MADERPRLRPAQFAKQESLDTLAEEVNAALGEVAAQLTVLTHLVARLAEEVEDITGALFEEEEPEGPEPEEAASPYSPGELEADLGSNRLREHAPGADDEDADYIREAPSDDAQA